MRKIRENLSNSEKKCDMSSEREKGRGISSFKNTSLKIMSGSGKSRRRIKVKLSWHKPSLIIQINSEKVNNQDKKFLLEVKSFSVTQPELRLTFFDAVLGSISALKRNEKFVFWGITKLNSCPSLPLLLPHRLTPEE